MGSVTWPLDRKWLARQWRKQISLRSTIFRKGEGRGKGWRF
jgi:hypothetical protein